MHFFIVWMAEHWHGLPKEAVDLILGDLQNLLSTVLDILLYMVLFEQGGVRLDDLPLPTLISL